MTLRCHRCRAPRRNRSRGGDPSPQRVGVAVLGGEHVVGDGGGGHRDDERRRIRRPAGGTGRPHAVERPVREAVDGGRIGSGACAALSSCRK